MNQATEPDYCGEIPTYQPGNNGKVPKNFVRYILTLLNMGPLNRRFTVLRLQWTQLSPLRFAQCVGIHHIVTLRFVKSDSPFIVEFIRFNSAVL